MRELFFKVLLTVSFCVFLALAVSCRQQSSDSGTKATEVPVETVTDTATPPGTESIPPVKKSEAQNILDNIYQTVELKSGRIFLSFGARGTLTVNNFNKLIFEEQLGLEKGRFTFIIDEAILNALRNDDAYGGIGFDQEWITAMTIRILDNVTGECSDLKTLTFTLRKSYEADRRLNSIGYITPTAGTQ